MKNEILSKHDLTAQLANKIVDKSNSLVVNSNFTISGMQRHAAVCLIQAALLVLIEERIIIVQNIKKE